MNVYGQLLRAQLEQLAADPVGLAAIEGRVYWNTVEKQAKVYQGTAWTGLGSGAGVGAFLDLYPKPGDSPIEEEDGAGLKYWEFEDEFTTQTLTGFLKVPNNHISGTQLFVAITVESDEAGSAALIMQAKTILVRPGTDPMSSTTNFNTDTATYSPAAVVAQELVLDLTDANGEINAIVVNAGDILKVEFTKPTDASTENIRLFESLVEVRS